MKAQQTHIYIDGQKKPISLGLVSITNLYNLIDSGKKKIFFNREDGTHIPLLPNENEYLIIHGEEKFVIRDDLVEGSLPKVQPEFNGSCITLPHIKIQGKTLREQDDKFPQGHLFAHIKGSIDIKISENMILIVQDKDSYFVIPLSAIDEEDIIDIEECGKNNRRPPHGKKYRIRIDGQKYVVDSPKLTGGEILVLAGKSYDEWSLNQKLHGGRRKKIGLNDKVDLTHLGIERFETVRLQAQQGKKMYHGFILRRH